MTIGRETFKVPDPFLVLATQNPIETEGTYALPEAQIDRFMLKVLVGYPSPTEEFVIVERMTGPLPTVEQVLSTDGLIAMQQAADAVYVDPGAVRVRRPAGDRDPVARPHRPAGAAALHHLRRQPARVDQPDPHRARPGLRPRPRLRRCPRTSSTWPSTSCATAWCSRSRPCPTMSPATRSWAPSSSRIPVPVVPLREHDDVHVSA